MTQDTARPVKRTRTVRNFPSSTFRDVFEFSQKVYEVGSGQQVRRLTLFDLIGKSPDSSTSRMWITNSAKYGLTKGSYTAEFIELTPLGAKIFNETIPLRERERAKIDAAILSIPPFKSVYEAVVGNKLPAIAVLVDKIKEFDVTAETAEEAIDIFIVNLREVGLLKTLSGAEKIIPIDMKLDELPSSNLRGMASSADLSSTQFHNLNDANGYVSTKGQAVITADRADYETTAFYVSPIGEDGSDTRKHADLFSSSIVEPALEQFGLKLIRADQIESPGIITRQILDYIINSRLVIADLSFHNPNVFYELAIRHLMRKPIVQIVRTRDRIPFDISQSRTIKIDDIDIYTFVPKIPVYIATISAQVRQALENPDSGDNPISIYYPALSAEIRTPQTRIEKA